MEKQSPVPNRLREAREKVGLSQKALGIEAGMDPFSASARMNQYEQGKHTPDYATLSSIARVLCVPVAYFYAEDDLLAQAILLLGNKSAEELEGIIHACSK